MATITRYPTANTPTTDFNGVAINPTDAYTDNGVDATLVPSKPRNDEDAHCWSGFDFSAIPDGSVINSVTVEVDTRLSATWTQGQWRGTLWADADSGAALLRDYASAIGAAQYTRPTTTSAQQVWDWGTLGTEPTLAELKTAKFGVRIEAAQGNNATSHTWYMDYIRVTVDYTVASEDYSGSGSIDETHSVTATGTKYESSPAVIDQDAARFRNADGDEVTATWKAPLNSDADVEIETLFRIRFLIQNTDGEDAPTSDDWTLYYSKNGGGWLRVLDTTPVFLAQQGGSNVATTQQIGSGDFVPGEWHDNEGGDNEIFDQGIPTLYETEFEWTVEATANNGAAVLDDYDFRMYRNGAVLDSYTTIIRATVVASSDKSGSGSITETHSITATGVKAEDSEDYSGSGTIDETHSVVATGQPARLGSGTIDETHSVTGTGAKATAATATIAITGTVTGAGTKYETGQLNHDFEGEADESDISNTSSGPDTLDNSYAGTDAEGVYDDTRAKEGSMSGRFSTGATQTTTFIRFDFDASPSNEVWGRMYGYVTALPAVNTIVLQAREAAGAIAVYSLRLNTDGTLLLFRSSPGFQALALGVEVVPTDEWFRIEIYGLGHATAGVATARLFVGDDLEKESSAVNATEEIGATSIEADYTMGAVATGILTGQINSEDLWVDDFAGTSVNWPAPTGATSEHYSGSGSIVETHSVVGVAAKGGEDAGSITHSHSVTAVGAAGKEGAASISHGHTVVAAGVAAEFHEGSGSIDHGHSVVAAGAGSRADSGTIPLTATVVATGVKVEQENKSGSGSITETHSVVAVGQRGASDDASVVSTHDVSSVGAKGATADASVASSHSVVGVGAGQRADSGVISVTATVVATGVKSDADNKFGTGSIVETHSVVAAGVKAAADSGVIVISASPTASGEKGASQAGSISQVASLVAIGAKQASGAGTILHGHSVTGSGSKAEDSVDHSGSGAITHSHSVVATGIKNALGAASINVPLSIVATGDALEFHSGTASIVETHSVAATGVKSDADNKFGAGSIVETHTVTATGVKASPLSHDAEGEADETDVTTSTSGYDTLDNVWKEPNTGVFKYDTDLAKRGAASMRLSTGEDSGTVHGRLNVDEVAGELWASVYARRSSAPSISTAVLQLKYSGGTIGLWSIYWNPDNTWILVQNRPTTLIVEWGQIDLPNNEWVRFDLYGKTGA